MKLTPSATHRYRCSEEKICLMYLFKNIIRSFISLMRRISKLSRNKKCSLSPNSLHETICEVIKLMASRLSRMLSREFNCVMNTWLPCSIISFSSSTRQNICLLSPPNSFTCKMQPKAVRSKIQRHGHSV